MRRYALFIIPVLLFIAAVVMVQAQDATPESMIGIPVCDYAALGTALAVEGEALAGQEDPAGRLLTIQAALATFRAECDGYSFTSAEFGADAVTDPILFRDGSYRMRLTSTAITSANIEAVEGDCDFVFIYTDTEGGEAEDFLQLEDCVGVLNIDGLEDSAWELVLEPLVQPGD